MPPRPPSSTLFPYTTLFRSQLAGELEGGGCPCVAFVPARGEGWLGRELAAAGVTVETFELARPFSPKLSRDLVTAFRRHRIDLAHGHDFSMAFYGAWAARRAGVPHVITMHGGRYYADRLRRRLVMRAAVTASGALVAVSQGLSAHLAHDLWLRANRIITIPNGVRFKPAAAESTLRAELGLASGAVGLLVPPGDSAALAGALQRLLVQPFEAQRLGHSAQARAAAEYGIGRMVQRYAELYGRLLARRPESESAADPNTS